VEWTLLLHTILSTLFSFLIAILGLVLCKKRQILCQCIDRTCTARCCPGIRQQIDERAERRRVIYNDSSEETACHSSSEEIVYHSPGEPSRTRWYCHVDSQEDFGLASQEDSEDYFDVTEVWCVFCICPCICLLCKHPVFFFKSHFSWPHSSLCGLNLPRIWSLTSKRKHIHTHTQLACKQNIPCSPDNNNSTRISFKHITRR
jgi:hypothetical protein